MGRLRPAEVVTGAAAVALAVLMLAAHWYGTRTGWQVLTSERWLALVTIVLALALVLTQATRPAPAIPVTLSLLTTVLGVLNGLWLIYRVAISAAAHQHVASWLGLISAWVTVAAAFWSMRQEGIAPGDEPREIPVVPLRGERSVAN
jgi:4-amino-4-deoxy-L-arabinose transferase-like glycosyltransferase